MRLRGRIHTVEDSEICLLFLAYFDLAFMPPEFFAVVDSDKQNVSGIFFQSICVFFSFYLINGSFCRLIPF